jgi:hypothetical protein
MGGSADLAARLVFAELQDTVADLSKRKLRIGSTAW